MSYKYVKSGRLAQIRHLYEFCPRTHTILSHLFLFEQCGAAAAFPIPKYHYVKCVNFLLYCIIVELLVMSLISFWYLRHRF